MVLHVDGDVRVRLRHMDGHDRLLAAKPDKRLLIGILHAIQHVLQDLGQDRVEEVIDGGEVEFDVEGCDVGLIVPQVLFVSLRPIVAGVLSEELCRQQRDEVDLKVGAVAKAVEQLVAFGPLHDTGDLLFGEVEIRAFDLSLWPGVEDNGQVLQGGDVVGEGVLVRVRIQAQFL